MASQDKLTPKNAAVWGAVSKASRGPTFGLAFIAATSPLTSLAECAATATQIARPSPAMVVKLDAQPKSCTATKITKPLQIFVVADFYAGHAPAS